MCSSPIKISLNRARSDVGGSGAARAEARGTERRGARGSGAAHAARRGRLRRGPPVRSSDGVQIGTVRRAQETGRENIFDGIIIDTKDGRGFVDAPEVA